MWAAIGFGLLCLLLASRWLIEGGLPATASTYESQAIGDLLAAGALGVFAVVGRRERLADAAGNGLWVRALAGVLVLCGPVVCEAIAGRRLGSGNATVALALVPVVVAVAGASRHDGDGGEMPGHLWPGLAGLAGLLLLLPQPSFSSVRAWVGLGALPLLTGWGVAFFAGSADENHGGEEGKQLWSGPIGCVGAAIVMTLAAAHNRQPGASVDWPMQAAGLDAMVAAATLFLLSRGTAGRFSALYLVVPLLTMVEGVIFLHPVLDFRSWVAFGLLLVSAARLLFGGAGRPANGLALQVPERVPPA